MAPGFVEKIVNLAGAYSPAVVGLALQRALEYGAFGYGSLKGILMRFETALKACRTPPVLKQSPFLWN
jgi:hypothetical protein